MPLIMTPIQSSIYLAAAFPYFLHFGGRSIHPHVFFEALAYLLAVGAYLFLRRWFGDPIYTPLRWVVTAVALVGALVGSKLLYWLENPSLTWHHRSDVAYVLGGKTIVGALGLGLAAVELSKRYLGLRRSTGDLYAIPLAVGVAVGRIGCFLSGLEDNTYGTPTALAWGVDFGDGIRRHPTQLYEAVFLLALVPPLLRLLRKISESTRQTVPANATGLRAGDVFKVFLIAYASFRLLVDFLKPYPRVFLGLGAIQWASLLILVYYAADILRWFRSANNVQLTDQGEGQLPPSRLSTNR